MYNISVVWFMVPQKHLPAGMEENYNKYSR